MTMIQLMGLGKCWKAVDMPDGFKCNSMDMTSWVWTWLRERFIKIL